MVVKKVRNQAGVSAVRKANGHSSSERRGATARVDLVLPKKPNEPPGDFEDFCVMIYGDKGVGKSSLGAEFRNAITLMAEPRRRNLRILQVPDPNSKEPQLNWRRVEAYGALIKEQGDFQTVVLDTVDRIYEMAFNHVCEKRGKTHPNDAPNDYGQTWREIKDALDGLIQGFLWAGLNPVLLSHARWREVTTVSGDQFEQVTPTCPDACWTICKALTDFAFYYGYRGQRRTFTIRGNDRIWASCGTGEDHFLDPKGRPIAFLPAGNSPKQAHKTLVDSFNNKLYGEIYTEGDDEPEVESEPEKVSLPKGFKKKK